MLHSTTTHLDELIIRALALKPGLTAAELHGKLSKEGRACTIQGVYHELRKLMRTGVVVKLEKKFSLSLFWSYEIIGLADQIYDHYLTTIPAPFTLPAEGQRRSWKFMLLERANDFQVQLTFLLLNDSHAKRVFQWFPYPVTTLFRGNQSMRIQQVLELTEGVAYRILGTRTPLSQDCLKRWNKKSVIYSDAVSTFEQERTKHVTVVGEYILTLVLTKAFSDKIEEVFRKFRTIGDVVTGGGFAELRAKSKIQVTLEHNKRKSAELTKRFVDYFGIKN